MKSLPHTLRNRLAVSLAVSLVAAVVHYLRANVNRGWSDFAPLWYAARIAWSGGNPYEMLGPDKPIWSKWPMFYPATSFVVASPFAIIPSFHVASAAYVFVFSFALAWGATHDGWHRLPIFPSVAFITSAALAQWSIAMTAMVYLPWLGIIAVAKPQNAAPVLASTRESRTWLYALVGGATVIAISLLLVPGWPADWLRVVRTTDNFVPPVLRFGGPLILIVLLKWRRPESWLILISALMPQTWPPYNGLILFTVAETYYEFAALSIISSLAWLISAYMGFGMNEMQERSWMSATLNLFGYLPAALVVLRRRNEGSGPLWMNFIFARRKSVRS